MKSQLKIILLVSAAIFVACGFSAKQNSPEPLVENLTGTIYANEYGQIELIELNDTLMRTVFSDNEKIVFDTLMKIDYHFKLLPEDGYPFLWLKTGGIKIHENRIHVHDFAGPAYMQMYTKIENIYDRPFYKINEKITIKDEIKRSKGGETISRIYLSEGSEYENQFVHLTGIVTKEKYPREYYSTPDGPQGMFSDTIIIHYRLVVKDYMIEPIKKEIYTGTTINIDGRRAFIWDFADSEAFFLDDTFPPTEWGKNELNKKIKIEAVLVQFVDGKSVLKAWQIIE